MGLSPFFFFKGANRNDSRELVVMAAEAREPFRDAQKRLKDATLKRLHEACRLGRSDDVMKMMVGLSLLSITCAFHSFRSAHACCVLHVFFHSFRSAHACCILLRFAPVCTVPALRQILFMLRLFACFGLAFRCLIASFRCGMLRRSDGIFFFYYPSWLTMQSEVLEIIGINDKVTIQFCFAAYEGTSYQPHAGGSTLPWVPPAKAMAQGLCWC